MDVIDADVAVPGRLGAAVGGRALLIDGHDPPPPDPL